MGLINRLYNDLKDNDLPESQIRAQIAFAQNQGFFHLAAAKEVRRKKLSHFFGQTGMRQLILSGNLAGFECDIPDLSVSILPKGYFEALSDAQLELAIARFKHAVVIINNNDLGSPEARVNYLKLYELCESTCFVAWDWDNHHWLELSIFLAAHTDIYSPAHHENLYLLTRYNWLTAGPVYCTSVQWSRKFLASHLALMLSHERKSVPLGMHIPYSKFEFRIQVINTLSQHYPSIGFSNRSFHARTPEDRLGEWIDYKMHWIMPVLNDVPIRIFDALITGGIAIVPSSLRLLQPMAGLPEDFVVYYSPDDIVDPARVVQKALKVFDEAGAEGIARRHRYAMDRFHGEASVQHMLSHVRQALELP